MGLLIFLFLITLMEFFVQKRSDCTINPDYKTFSSFNEKLKKENDKELSNRNYIY
jgi:hypothetical protein